MLKDLISNTSKSAFQDPRFKPVTEDEVEDFSTLDETGSLADFDDAFADETEEDDIDDGDNVAIIDTDGNLYAAAHLSEEEADTIYQAIQ